MGNAANLKRMVLAGAASLSVVCGGAMSPDAVAVDPVAASVGVRDEVDIALEKYVDDTTLLFDIDRAVRDGESVEINQFGRDYNDAVRYAYENCFAERLNSPSADIGDSYVQPQGVDPAGWPIAERWNWCGRDRTDGGEPQNSADAVCRDHDLCLRGGTETCECDRRFVDGLNAVKRDYSWADRAYIEAAIRLVPRAHNC